jgi:ADP-ribose pyrophosphatase YjhB (NUDIX family)
VSAPEPLPGRQVTRVSAYALCRDDDRVLLCRIAPGYWSGVGSWTLPGGGLEFGESPRDGVIRELAEETGLDGVIEALVEVFDWASDWIHPRDAVDEAFHAIQIVYRVRITGGALRNEPDGSTDVAAWFTRAEAEALPLVELAQAGVRLAFGDPAS